MNADDEWPLATKSNDPFYEKPSFNINLFVYCDDNPINKEDPEGRDAIAIAAGTFSLATVVDFICILAVFLWVVVAIITAVGFGVKGIKDVIKYSKQNSSGKKARDSSKNEPHGNQGAAKKAEKQAKALRDQAKRTKNKKERKKLLKKAENVIKAGQKAKKGENHSQSKKR